jgi:archaellum component FlaC
LIKNKNKMEISMFIENTEIKEKITCMECALTLENGVRDLSDAIKNIKRGLSQYRANINRLNELENE